MSLVADYNLKVSLKERREAKENLDFARSRKEEPRTDLCEGCRTGNFWLCKSFPGVAKTHVEREQEVAKKKKQRKRPTRLEIAASEEERPSPRVFRRDRGV